MKAGSSTTITVTATPPTNAPAGHTDINVTATAGTKTSHGKLGDRHHRLVQADPLDAGRRPVAPRLGRLAARPRRSSQEHRHGADMNGVMTATQPSGWTVTFDPMIDRHDRARRHGHGHRDDHPVLRRGRRRLRGDVQRRQRRRGCRRDGRADMRFTVETSPLWAIVGIGIIVLILAGPVLRLPDLRPAMTAPSTRPVR